MSCISYAWGVLLLAVQIKGVMSAAHLLLSMWITHRGSSQAKLLLIGWLATSTSIFVHDPCLVALNIAYRHEQVQRAQKHIRLIAATIAQAGCQT